jgi:hypothetical protein
MDVQGLAGTRVAVVVIPAPRVGYVGEGVPNEMVRDFNEARGCEAAGFHYGATLVARRVIQAAARKVEAQGNTLYDELESIREKLGVVFDMADVVRDYGNDAAHPPDAVAAENVPALLLFTERVLERLFVEPAALAKLKKHARSPPKAG